MADSTIDSELFVLCDLWPGAPQVSGENKKPQDNFAGAATHNVSAATAGVRVGEKRQVYCDGSVGKAGWSTLMYLRLGTQAGTMAAKAVCSLESGTVWYQVTNDPDTAINKAGGPCAIAISAMTNTNYGWFWVGGVCPEQYISGLGGDYATEGTVAAGKPMSISDLAADAMGFSLTAADSEMVCGWTLADDAAS